MAEFNVHHSIHQLLQILDVQNEPSKGITEDVIAENLIKSANQANQKIVPTAKFIKKLEGVNKSDFKSIYDELKAKNVIEVDNLVQFLARVSDSNDVKSFLRFHKHLRENSIKRASIDKNGSRPSTLSNRYSQSTSKETDENKATNNYQPTPSANSSSPSQPTSHYSQKSVDTPENKKLSESSPKSPLSIKTGKRESIKSKSERKIDFSLLTYDFKHFEWPAEVVIPQLSAMSVTDQQKALIDDLLYVLVGIEGRYIRKKIFEKKVSRLVIDDGTDKLLKTLVERITTICPLYSMVVHFIEHHDHGLVNQALISFMRSVIHDYFIRITQLEHMHRLGDMTLQKMWYLLQDIYYQLEILRQVGCKIFQGKSIGGAVLSILHEKTVSHTGNIRASQFCMKMTSTACEAYFNILERWISEGIIFDPYKEFFIEDTGCESGEERLMGSNDDSYWENRYEIVPSRMPIFLSRFADKIMKTGKYLTVIRECGKEIGESPACEPLRYTVEDRIYAERIGIAYQYASKKLLHMLLDKSDLIAHFNSVKHYFFMDKGDFLVLFMDIAEDELKKDIDDIAPTRLQSLLELAVRTSAMSTDPHADLLGIELLNDSVLYQLSQILSHGSLSTSTDDLSAVPQENLKGYEALALRYKVEWPLSLILNQRNIACYQMLFRHLFYCKYVERQLGTTWKDSKITKRYLLKAVKSYAEAFGLRQKMLNFVQNLEYYMMVEVIEPNFHTFLQKVNSKVNSIDDMINEHTIFMEGCLQDCMLTQKKALKLMVKLLNLCMEFALFMQKTHQLSAQFELQGVNDVLLKAYECEPLNEESEDKKSPCITSFQKKISQLHSDFNESLQALLKEIINQQNDHYTGKMLHILCRLDFNEYYGKMEEGYSQPA